MPVDEKGGRQKRPDVGRSDQSEGARPGGMRRVASPLLALALGSSGALYADISSGFPAALKFNGAFALILSVLLVVRWRKNPALLIVATVIAYFNYSVLLAYYIWPEAGLTPVLRIAATAENLNIGLTCILAFLAALHGFAAPRWRFTTPAAVHHGDTAVFFLSVVALAYVGLFEVNREGATSVYQVRISPLYEYSFILVILALVAAGRSRAQQVLVTVVAFALILQDAFYGGRATSLQVLIVFALFLVPRQLRLVRMVGAMGIVIVLFTFVGIVRTTRQGVTFMDAVRRLVEGAFVSDTATHAYYASLTHIQAASAIAPSERKLLLESFTRQVFLGGESSNMVTTYIAANYIPNAGGGFFYTHFYVLGGMVSVVVASVALGSMLVRIASIESPRYSMLLIASAASVIRWYPYSPTSLLRVVFLVGVMSAAYYLWARRDREVGRGVENEASPRSAEAPIGSRGATGARRGD